MKENLIKAVTKAMEEVKKTGGTYYWYLHSNDMENDWAIVLGYLGTRLYIKLAYQPCNSVMQCDYDIDWLMPYDKETGEVDDTEVRIYQDIDIEETIDWLLKCYERYN